jgi:hypothetical protein
MLLVCLNSHLIFDKNLELSRGFSYRFSGACACLDVPKNANLKAFYHLNARVFVAIWEFFDKRTSEFSHAILLVFLGQRQYGLKTGHLLLFLVFFENCIFCVAC